MDVEITFDSGRVIRTYDETVETAEEGLELVSQHSGWIELGGVVFHSKRVESLRWLDPVVDTQEVTSS